MKKLQNRRWVFGLVTGLVVMTTTGCMSKEDRIKDVISHEVEKCKQAEEEFYEVVAHDGSTFRILSQICDEEMSDVVMNNEFTGDLKMGPLVWTGGEDAESRAMVITRVAWSEFDRAMRYRGQRDPGVDELGAAETSFAKAQEEYPASDWLRLERLRNLIDLQEARRREVENPASIGEAAMAQLNETIAWARENEDPVTEAKARLAVWSYLSDFRDGQQRNISNLGSGDRRIQAAIDHAEEEGNREDFETYTRELEERMARRPEAQAEMEARMLTAEREMCEVRRGLTVTGIDEDSLRARITSALRHDCAEALVANESGSEGPSDVEE